MWEPFTLVGAFTALKPLTPTKILQILMLRARVALRSSDAQWALADAARAVEVAVESPELLTGCWENLAGVAYAAGRYDVALRSLRKALELEPTSKGVHLFVGVMGACARDATHA